MTDTIDPAVRQWWFTESDRRDAELENRLSAWREGYAAGEAAHQDDYERGIHDGITGYKKATKDIVTMARLQVARYGPDSRQATHPQPGDFPMLLTARDGER